VSAARLARASVRIAAGSLVPGIQGKAESVDPPNNNGYERTLKWTNINKAIQALTPFADKTAAGKAGFDTTKPYQFKPFTPKPPEPLGDFHSFIGRRA